MTQFCCPWCRLEKISCLATKKSSACRLEEEARGSEGTCIGKGWEESCLQLECKNYSVRPLTLPGFWSFLSFSGAVDYVVSSYIIEHS